MEQCQHYIGIACARCGDWADDIIRDLEEQVRESREALKKARDLYAVAACPGCRSAIYTNHIAEMDAVLATATS